MKKWQRIVGIVFVFFTLTSSMIVWSVTSKEANIGISYEKAVLENKPFVLMFYTPWCSYCKAFKPVFKNLSIIYKDNYNFVMVDGDNPINIPIARDYLISSFPSLFIVDSSIDNRIYLNPTLYDSEEKIKIELNRYLRIRSMIK